MPSPPRSRCQASAGRWPPSKRNYRTPSLSAISRASTTAESLTWASLPSVAPAGPYGPTLESLPQLPFQTSDCLPLPEDVDDHAGVHIDFQNWGLSAIRQFGYEVGDFAWFVPSSGLSCAQRQAWRKADGGAVLLKATTSSKGLVPKGVRQELRAELRMLRAFNHPAVIKVEAFLETRFDSFLILDFPSMHTAQSCVDKRGPFRESFAMNLFRQLLEGIEYIHDRGVAHGALCPANMCFDESRSLLTISDFSQARSVASASEPSSTRPHEPSLRLPEQLAYQAPEQVFQRRWGEAADIWAAGLALHFMLLSTLPFDIRDDAAAEVLREGHLPRLVSGETGISMPLPALRVLRQCLAVLALQRPSACHLLRGMEGESRA